MLHPASSSALENFTASTIIGALIVTEGAWPI
jgi:hypothetical protein